MEAPHPLREFKPAREFFVGVDSDGCVFDTMEIKHKECFIPMFIKHFELQAVSRYARETWEFVNLYSKTRGANRFPALSLALNLLRERPEVKARGAIIPDTLALDQWLARETKLGSAALDAEVRHGNRGLVQVKVWSDAVNVCIEDIVHAVPPFPFVRECLERLVQKADVLVVSQTPTAALEREWAEHGLGEFPRLIAGQELGTKTEHLKLAAAGKYPAHQILMIGDAPGDLKAAQANGALFFPIEPGDEARSWQQLHDEALQRFFEGSYAGDYESKLIREFNARLPEKPPWGRNNAFAT